MTTRSERLGGPARAGAAPVTTASSGPRDPAVDLLRVVGVLAVVAGHLWTSGWVRDGLFAWHVPVFFVLAGYLWRRRDWRSELRVRAASLLRPYVAWLVLVALVVAVADAFGSGPAAVPRDPWALVRGGAALSGPFTAFWFVTCLAAACVLYALVDRGPPVRVTGVVLAVAVSTTAGDWLAATPLSVGMALPALGLIEVGRQVRRWTGVLDRPLAAVPATAVLVAAAAAAAAGVLPVLDMKLGELGPASIGLVTGAVVVVALLVLCRRAARRLPPAVVTGLGRTSAVLVPVVLVHPLLLALPAPDLARFAAAVTVPLGVALLLARTPLSGWLNGR